MSIIVVLSILLLLSVVSLIIVGLDVKMNESPIVISLTTSPLRIGKMKVVIDSLINQTIKPEKIFICIPEKYREEEPYEIPAWLKEYPLVEINRIPKDYGPASKLLGCIDKVGKNHTILYCDDDIEYPCRMVESHLKLGKSDTVNALELYQGIYPCGYGGVSLRRYLIQDDFKSFIEKAIQNKDCYLSDDLVIGEYFHSKNVKINKIESALYNYTMPSILYGVQKYGLLGDSLWLQDGLMGVIDNHESKYCRCKTYMNGNL